MTDASTTLAASPAPPPLNRTVEIFAIGNELLVGQVLDTNSHWLIRQITALGAQVRRGMILRDEYDVIVPESTLRRWHLSVINDRDDAWPAEEVAS